jgi:hypothetical protein
VRLRLVPEGALDSWTRSRSRNGGACAPLLPASEFCAPRMTQVPESSALRLGRSRAASAARPAPVSIGPSHSPGRDVGHHNRTQCCSSQQRIGRTRRFGSLFEVPVTHDAETTAGVRPCISVAERPVVLPLSKGHAVTAVDEYNKYARDCLRWAARALAARRPPQRASHSSSAAWILGSTCASSGVKIRSFLVVRWDRTGARAPWP